MGASAGRVLLIPKGDWNADTTYTGLDWVRHNGAAWVCKNTCTNVEPTEANSDNWQIMARDGTEITVDAEISDQSENPVQNKAIKKYVDDHSTDVADMTGATATQNGAHGLVPAPKIGDENKALLGNGTWGSVDSILTFKTKEKYDAAVANDEIPDGAKVIKEYDDGDSTAIIDVDTVMSDTSDNPVQNKVIKKYVDARKSSIGQNLIPYPYYRPNSYTTNGITWTVNEDGSITVNGTATSTAFYAIFTGQLGLEIGKSYVLTLTTAEGEASLYLANKNKQNANMNIASCHKVNNSTIEKIFQYSQIDDFDHDELGLYITPGTTLTNCIIKFQLECGTIRHEYQPTTLSNHTLKKKIEGITVDSEVSDTSTHPIQNKAMKAYVDAKKVPTFGVENVISSVLVVGSDGNFITPNNTWEGSNNFLSCVFKAPAGQTSINVSLNIPANSIVLLSSCSQGGEDIRHRSPNIFSNIGGNSAISRSYNLYIEHSVEASHVILFYPLVIHLA